MKPSTENILRWIAIVGCGGFGVWQLFDAIYDVLPWNGNWLGTLFVLTVQSLIAGPFLAVAYFCLRRQYRKLYLILGVVGAFALFVGLSVLPDQLGVERLFHDNRAQPGFGLVVMSIVVLCLFGPIFPAAWFYRFCHRLAYRATGGENGNARPPKTRATRWLVWLGLICVVILPVADSLFTFTRMLGDPTPTFSRDEVAGLFSRTAGMYAFGIS